MDSDSSSSSGRSSTTTKSTHKMSRRSADHQMSLRKRPAERQVLQGRIAKKYAKSPVAKVAQQKINREAILSKQFLDTLEWTPWNLAMVNDSSLSCSKVWSSRPGDRQGVRYEGLVKDTDIPAVYEFAVATPVSDSKYAVYASVTKGFNHQSWENKFLSQSHLQKQLDCVLNRDCRLYVRSAPVTSDSADDVNDSVAKLRHILATKYDYAWQEHYNTQTRTYHHRRLYKNGVLISE